ncbi:MAG: dienelactone hydrolase family protein, partial [Chloroflexi bacterium]|nr:dienelactone hydrolase family protein [Chloroflexota bacterium]
MAAYEGMIAETVLFQGHDGDQVSGYFARPTGAGPYPGVIVICEVFGLVTHIKEIARKMAAHGYAAIAPDLHYREGPGDPEDVAAIVRAAGGNPDARTIGDVEGSASYLRSLRS